MRASGQNSDTGILMFNSKSIERNACMQPASKYQKERIGKREAKIFLATPRLGPHFTHHDKALPATKKELIQQQKNLCSNAEETQTLRTDKSNGWHGYDPMDQQNRHKKELFLKYYLG